MDGVTITHEATETGGLYTAQVSGEQHKGTLEWEPKTDAQGDVRVATHTIVPPAIGGRGIAGQLVKQLIADARDQGFRIVPQCSYVAKKFDNNPDWADLRA
ncbi:MAG: GNAT family N-acetyltransferase [Pseudomonadota bacterium]|nr:GNAT family N-acetyltransferase [Pseudomonadota bacterium]